MSFFVCADAPAADPRRRRDELPDAPAFFAELREGWREFTSRTWLWASVLLFGLGNLAFAGWHVLGPAIAEESLGGAGAWATILAAGGIGAVGGLRRSRSGSDPTGRWSRASSPRCRSRSSARARPRRADLGRSRPPRSSRGAGLAVHLTLWFTVFQQQVPERAQSRVSSYDTLGSFVLMPLGYAIVGPLADAIGPQETLWLALA